MAPNQSGKVVWSDLQAKTWPTSAMKFRAPVPASFSSTSAGPSQTYGLDPAFDLHRRFIHLNAGHGSRQSLRLTLPASMGITATALLHA